MSIDRIFYCDGPDGKSPDDEDGCPVHVRCATTRPSAGSGFIFVTSPSDTAKTLHFCGWDCLMKYAAARPLPIEIPWHGEGEAA